jgi:hypothetical protein
VDDLLVSIMGVRTNLKLSVVMCLTSGTTSALGDCPRKLHRGAEVIDLEWIVPYDDRLGKVSELEKSFDCIGFFDA